MKGHRTARVVYPDSESYTVDALTSAFEAILPDWNIDTSCPPGPSQPGKEDCTLHGKPVGRYDVQYCDYDELAWDMAEQPGVLTNSYILRKALIRKSYLSTAVRHRLAKKPDSILATAVPQTWTFEIAHADELDELFYDELYELGQALDDDAEAKQRTWILKPAMSDKAQGIRLFRTRQQLQKIMESFEDDEGETSDEDEEHQESSANSNSHATEQSDKDRSGTRVSLSHMRDWVIQEYVSEPLLFEPSLSSPGERPPAPGRKFHLRVYTLAVGALQVYVSTQMLALFASKPYATPTVDITADERDIDIDEELAAHLTNTCLQDPESAEKSVFLLSDLTKMPILSTDGSEVGTFAQADLQNVIQQIGSIIGEAFQAGLGMPNHFAVSPDGFEVFGIDILLSRSVQEENSKITAHLLEINACPDFRQTGPHLQSVIQRLFEGVLKIAVKPYFEKDKEQGDRSEHSSAWIVGEERDGWLKCLDEQVKPTARPW